VLLPLISRPLPDGRAVDDRRKEDLNPDRLRLGVRVVRLHEIGRESIVLLLLRGLRRALRRVFPAGDPPDLDSDAAIILDDVEVRWFVAVEHSVTFQPRSFNIRSRNIRSRLFEAMCISFSRAAGASG